MASPEANLRQKGFFVNRKDFAQFVRSWLSKMKRFAGEILLKVIVLDTARGIVIKTFLVRKIAALFVFVFMHVITQMSLLLSMEKTRLS